MIEKQNKIAKALVDEPLRIRKSIGEIGGQVTERDVDDLGKILHTDFEIEFVDPCTLWLYSVKEV